MIRAELPATFGRRLAAFTIDLVIIGVIIATVVPMTEGYAVVATMLSQIGDYAWVFLFLLYFWLITGLLGRTPGKMLVGVELRAARGRVGFGTAFVREVIGKVVSFGVIGLGILDIALDREKRGWHDRFAGTRAVRVQTAVWSHEWESEIAGALAQRGEVHAGSTLQIPPAWQIAALQHFASLYRDDVMLVDKNLRPTGSVEWF